MAFPSRLLTIFSLLLLVASTLPSALGLIFNGKTISSANIGGVVFCVNQNLPINGTCKVVEGAPVELRCGSGTTDTLIKTVLTDVSGTYLLVINLMDTLVFDPSTCYIRVKIPPTACNLAVPTANLRAPLVVLNVVQALLGSLLGNLLTCIAGTFTLVA